MPIDSLKTRFGSGRVLGLDGSTVTPTLAAPASFTMLHLDLFFIRFRGPQAWMTD